MQYFHNSVQILLSGKYLYLFVTNLPFIDFVSPISSIYLFYIYERPAVPIHSLILFFLDTYLSLVLIIFTLYLHRTASRVEFRSLAGNCFLAQPQFRMSILNLRRFLVGLPSVKDFSRMIHYNSASADQSSTRLSSYTALRL